MHSLLCCVLLLCGGGAASSSGQESQAAATAPSVEYALVVHVEDPGKLLKEAQALKLAAPEASLETLLQPMFEKVTLPMIPSIDPTRSITAAVSKEGLVGAARGWTVVLGVRDVESVLETLGNGAAKHEVVGGIHRFEDEGGVLHVRSEPPYLFLGRNRDAVAGFDRKTTPANVDTPRGNVVVDLDVEPFASMLVAMLAAWPEQARAKMLAAIPEGDPTEPAPAAEIATEILALYAGMLTSLVENSSRLLLSAERIEPQVVLHLRLVSRVGSDLETLLLAQPSEFPRIGRAIPADGALMSFVAGVRLTPIVEQGLRIVLERQAALMERALPGEVFESVRAPLQLQQRVVQCMRGDMAATVHEGAEGLRTTSLFGIKSGSACESLLEEYEDTYAGLLGTSATPWSAPSAAGGESVHGASFEIQEAPTLEEAMSGEALAAPSMARVDDVFIMTSGESAGELLAEIVERQVGRKKAHGLGPERFAPLLARGGLFAEGDFARLASPETAEEGAGAPPSGRFAFGAWAERDRLAIDLVLPEAALAPAPPEPEEPSGPPTEAPETEEETDGKEPVVMDSEVTPPRLVYKVSPTYPELLRESRSGGTIILQAVITAEGTVESLTVLRCGGRSRGEDEASPGEIDPKFCTALSDAAFQAVRQWRYEPARKNGKPVAVYFTVKVDFELTQ